MVRFLCFDGQMAGNKTKKTANLSTENTVPSSSQNQAKNSVSLKSVFSFTHGNIGNTEGMDSSLTERGWKSEDMASKVVVGGNRGFFESGRLKKSQSLESGLHTKGKLHVDDSTEDRTDGLFSRNEIIMNSGLITLKECPKPPPTEQCAATFSNKPPIFSIGDLQNAENGRHVNFNADVPPSDNGVGSGNRTPRTPPLMVRARSLPNIGALSPVSAGFSRGLRPRSRSSEDLRVLRLRHNEMSIYELKMQLRPREGREYGAYDPPNIGFGNADDDGYHNANYCNSSRDMIVPVLDEVHLKSFQDAQPERLPLDDSPNKDFKIKRIEKWVIDLEPCSPLEDSDELLQSNEERIKDRAVVDVVEVKTDKKIIPGMEAVKTYISSLTASATACQLANHGLEVIPFLSAFVSLKVLNLSGNNIVRITAGALPRGLHMLNLSKNRIATIEGLRELTRLRVLDLSYNRIFRIGHGLASCSSLKELYLAGNKISEVEGLHRLLKLNILDLRFNKISTAKCLGQLAANYNSLQAISLEGNPAQKNVGDEQIKKYLQGLLPHLAHYNKQPMKVGALKDASERAVRLGGSSSYQFDRSLRSEAKSSRKSSHGIISKPSSSLLPRRSQAVAPLSKGKHVRLPPSGTRATLHHQEQQQHYHNDFGDKLQSLRLDLSMRRSRSEGTLGAL